MSMAQPENVYSSEAATVAIAASLRFQQKVIDISINAPNAVKTTCRLISQAEITFG